MKIFDQDRVFYEIPKGSQLHCIIFDKNWRMDRVNFFKFFDSLYKEYLNTYDKIEINMS